MPAWVFFCSRLSALAIPKSISFTSPSKLTSTFCGETSRCTMPSGLPCASRLRCAWSSASQTSATIKQTWGSGIASCRLRKRSISCRKSRPETYSMAM